MRNLIAVSVVGSMLFGLLAAGCGGSDQIDKQTYIKQADEICEQASGKLAADVASINQREAEKPNASFDKSRVALVEEGLVPRLEEELQKIRTLELPEEEKKQIEAFLDVYQQAIEKVKAKAKIIALTEKAAPQELIAVSATRLGITECPISPVGSN